MTVLIVLMLGADFVFKLFHIFFCAFSFEFFLYLYGIKIYYCFII